MANRRIVFFIIVIICIINQLRAKTVFGFGTGESVEEAYRQASEIIVSQLSPNVTTSSQSSTTHDDIFSSWTLFSADGILLGAKINSVKEKNDGTFMVQMSLDEDSVPAYQTLARTLSGEINTAYENLNRLENPLTVSYGDYLLLKSFMMEFEVVVDTIRLLDMNQDVPSINVTINQLNMALDKKVRAQEKEIEILSDAISYLDDMGYLALLAEQEMSISMPSGSNNVLVEGVVKDLEKLSALDYNYLYKKRVRNSEKSLESIISEYRDILNQIRRTKNKTDANLTLIRSKCEEEANRYRRSYLAEKNYLSIDRNAEGKVTREASLRRKDEAMKYIKREIYPKYEKEARSAYRKYLEEVSSLFSDAFSLIDKFNSNSYFTDSYSGETSIAVNRFDMGRATFIFTVDVRLLNNTASFEIEIPYEELTGRVFPDGQLTFSEHSEYMESVDLWLDFLKKHPDFFYVRVEIKGVISLTDDVKSGFNILDVQVSRIDNGKRLVKLNEQKETYEFKISFFDSSEILPSKGNLDFFDLNFHSMTGSLFRKIENLVGKYGDKAYQFVNGKLAPEEFEYSVKRYLDEAEKYDELSIANVEHYIGISGGWSFWIKESVGVVSLDYNADLVFFKKDMYFPVFIRIGGGPYIKSGYMRDGTFPDSYNIPNWLSFMQPNMRTDRDSFVSLGGSLRLGLGVYPSFYRRSKLVLSLVSGYDMYTGIPFAIELSYGLRSISLALRYEFAHLLYQTESAPSRNFSFLLSVGFTKK